MGRSLALIATFLGVVACTTSPEAPTENAASMGDFRLGFNVVVAGDALQGPGSRVVDDAAIQKAVEQAVVRRLGRYDGDGLYHLGIRVDVYSLSGPGSRVDSGMLMAVNVWDEATKQNLSSAPLEIEGRAPAGTMDLEALAESAAAALEDTLRRNAGTWFVPEPGQPRIAFDRDGVQGPATAAPN